MVLPFIKEEAIAQSPEEEKKDYGMLDALADDLLKAISKQDKTLLKSALQSLCDHIKYEDQSQDESLINQ